MVGNGGFGGDVLSEDVEWHRWKLKPVKHAGARGMHESRAFDPAVNRHREQRPIRDSALHPPRAANPLQECRDALRRAKLANQINRADVDPEFKRRSGNDGTDIATLHLLFEFVAPRPRNGAVVDANRIIAEQVA